MDAQAGAELSGANPGLVQDEYTATLNRGLVQEVDEVARMLGVSVRFADTVGGGLANAQISGGEIVLERDNPNPVRMLLGHELTHRVQELSPQSYLSFRAAAMAEIGDVDRRAAEIQSLYRQFGQELTREGAMLAEASAAPTHDHPEGININDDTTVVELAQMWVDLYKRPQVKPQTMRNILSWLNKHIIPVIGTKLVRKVKPVDCARVMAGVSDLTLGTQKHTLGCAPERRSVCSGTAWIFKPGPSMSGGSSSHVLKRGAASPGALRQ